MSEVNTQNNEPVQYNAEVAKQGGCGKSMFYVLVVLAIMTGCCCFGICGSYGYVTYWISSGLIEDPELIANYTEEYVGTIALPEDAEPTMGCILNWPMSSEFLFFMGTYQVPEDENRHSIFTFGALPDNLSDEFKNGLIEGYQEQFGKSLEDNGLRISEQSTISLEINGQTCNFDYTIFIDNAGHEFLSISGIFATPKSKNAYVWTLVNTERFSQDQIIEIVQSIK